MRGTFPGVDRYKAGRCHESYMESIRKPPFHCPLCKKETSRKSPYLIQGEFVDFMKGYHRICRKCFYENLEKYPDAKVSSGFPQPWDDAHYVLDTDFISGYRKVDRSELTTTCRGCI